MTDEIKLTLDEILDSLQAHMLEDYSIQEYDAFRDLTLPNIPSGQSEYRLCFMSGYAIACNYIKNRIKQKYNKEPEGLP